MILKRNKVELTHTDIKTAKAEAKKVLDSGHFDVPRMSIEIQENRWRAFTTGCLIKLEPDVEKFVKAALEAILFANIIVDQRDIYYSIRMGHSDWKIGGHELKTEEAYNTFVGTIMEKLQLATGFTMQSLGVRAGPRGYITGDDRSYFTLPDGKEIKISANPVIQFNLVDNGVEFKTNARKLIHYEKAAGMNSLLIENIPTMIEACFMTSQGYAVEAATKMHSDMERRGLKLFVLGDADPHGMSIQLMYGRASKSNAYMPDSFYPKTARLLGLFPRIAKELQLPAEHVADVHMRVVPNLKKIIAETNPSMMPDAEVFENERKQWEWQSLNGLGTEAPALYLIEALYAKGDEIKYVPDAQVMKDTMIATIKEELDEYVNDRLTSFAKKWLNENLFPSLMEQLKTKFFKDEIDAFNEKAAEELETLSHLNAEDFREAVKLKLVKNPKQYYGDAARKVIDEIISKRFDIDAKINATLDVADADVDQDVTITQMEQPEKPLEKHDIIESIEKRITGKSKLIQKIRDAIQKVIGKPSETW
jgi:DNA topoisomerase VI subunit A